MATLIAHIYRGIDGYRTTPSWFHDALCRHRVSQSREVRTERLVFDPVMSEVSGTGCGVSLGTATRVEVLIIVE